MKFFYSSKKKMEQFLFLLKCSFVFLIFTNCNFQKNNLDCADCTQYKQSGPPHFKCFTPIVQKSPFPDAFGADLGSISFFSILLEPGVRGFNTTLNLTFQSTSTLEHLGAVNVSILNSTRSTKLESSGMFGNTYNALDFVYNPVPYPSPTIYKTNGIYMWNSKSNQFVETQEIINIDFYDNGNSMSRLNSNQIYVPQPVASRSTMLTYTRPIKNISKSELIWVMVVTSPVLSPESEVTSFNNYWTTDSKCF